MSDLHPSSRAIRDVHRDGFTLTELIVALMLLTVGLLALASTASFLTAESAASSRAERAAVVAGSRLEILRTHGCASAQGRETVGELTATWAVVASEGSALASVTVSWTERGRPIIHRYTSGIAC